MNKKELLTNIFKGLPDNIDVTRQKVESIVDVMFEQMRSQLKIGHPVKLPGIGILKVKSMPARDGRNPKTGEPVRIDARRKATFVSSKSLKEAINE
jgi:DNA-binding protein HU-beta